MQIDIQARDFSLTDALRSHAEWRLRVALTCCNDHIQRVVIEGIETDLYVAIEALYDFMETLHNEKIGITKDIAAAATGIAVFVWLAVLGIKLSELWPRLTTD